MADKHIFKILERPNEVLLIIEINTLKFMQELNEDTFNLPYLKNKDLSKFLSKVIDKFQDKTLKFDYTLNLIDKSNLSFKIFLWDGTKHQFDIILKSKESRDTEIIDTKIKTSLDEYDSKIKQDILKIDRKYDDECDEINSKITDKSNEVKRDILSRYMNDSYRNWNYKSFKIVKCINKVNKSFEIQEETEKDRYNNIKDSYYENLYNQLIKYEDFSQFSKERYNEYSTNELGKKIYYLKMYLTHLSIYNVLEIILNNHGVINIIYLNIDYNKATYKVSIDIKFLYDDSEKRVYKCFPTLFKQELKNCQMIYNSLSNFFINKKDVLDMFIFQYIK
jgi:hypothetical protein